MTERVAIVGVGWSGFRPSTPELSYKELTYRAAVQAYADAGVDPRRDVDSFVTVAEDFHEGTSIFDEYTPDQLGAALRPMHTICGDGLHGLATAYMLIESGRAHTVVLEGHSKASNILSFGGISAYAQDPILNRPLGLDSLFIAGLEMNRYLFDTDTSLAQCAGVVVKNRRNALVNPRAPYGADLTVDEVLSGEPVAWPLTRHEIARHADGAIVMVLASAARAKAMAADPVWVRGVGWCNGEAALESRDWGDLTYVTKAARMAYRVAGLRQPRGAVDFAEVDDLFAYRELATIEALGLAGPGEAGLLLDEGGLDPDGELPVNVSGGSLGMGDLLEANGLARALEAVLQLRGQAGARQLDGPELALVESWRGLPTTSAAVALLGI